MDERKPWERLAGETTLWYERFVYYLKLGPERSVNQAANGYRADRGEPPKANHPTWYREAKARNWYARATAFDDVQRQQQLKQYRDKLEELHKTNLDIVSQMQKWLMDSLEDLKESHDARDVLYGLRTVVSSTAIVDKSMRGELVTEEEDTGPRVIKSPLAIPPVRSKDDSSD